MCQFGVLTPGAPDQKAISDFKTNSCCVPLMGVGAEVSHQHGEGYRFSLGFVKFHQKKHYHRFSFPQFQTSNLYQDLFYDLYPMALSD